MISPRQPSSSTTAGLEPTGPGTGTGRALIRRRTLAAKIGAIGTALLLLALATVGLTLYITWQLDGGAAAVNEAGRMRMQTWRLAQALSSAPDGDPQRMAPLIEQFDRSLVLLHDGDPARPLVVPNDDTSQQTLAQVRQQWQSLRAAWTRSPLPPAADITAQAAAFVATIDDNVSAIEHRLSTWTVWLNAMQITLMVLAMIAALALIYAAQMLVFTPLTRLQEGLARVESGDLSARVDAWGDDEFGTLAAGFNRMAERLASLYGNLERRVQEKTEHLESERARLEALYEAAAFTTQAGTLQELAQGFVRQLRRVAQADAAAVRWSDEHNQRYVLLAADGLPLDLAEAEHCLPTGGCYCGQPLARAQTRLFPLHDMRHVAPSLRANARHCSREGFVAIIGVPVRLHDRMLGELNLFYRQPATLTRDDRALLEALASHLAGAIEGLRADALQREAAVAEERGLLARELHDSIAQSLAFLKIQASLLRDEIHRGDTRNVGNTLAELDTGIRESLSDVRELLLHFRTRTNAEDIIPALRTTLTKFEHQTGIPAQLDVQGEGIALPPDVQLQVLHVVQEALSNVRKHAHAQHVHVDVRQSPRWQVSVRDDGRGFTSGGPAPDETHVGLRIMRERAQSIGAALVIDTTPGQGSRVSLTLPPLSPSAQENNDTIIQEHAHTADSDHPVAGH